jgi:hypothetical protein
MAKKTARKAPRSKKYVSFKGRMVMIGFGSIGQGVLPLILRHSASSQPDHHHRRGPAAVSLGQLYGVTFIEAADKSSRQMRAGWARRFCQPLGRGLVHGARRAVSGEGRALHRHLHRAVAGRLPTLPVGVTVPTMPCDTMLK